MSDKQVVTLDLTDKRNQNVNFNVYDSSAKSAYDVTVVGGNSAKLAYNVTIVGGRGKEGKSAYEIAVDRGFEGNEDEWLESLVKSIPSTVLGSEIICEKNSYYEFPNIGQESVLYIARDEDSIYRWDATHRKYYCVGRDYTKIKVIDGGSATNE